MDNGKWIMEKGLDRINKINKIEEVWLGIIL